MWGCNDRLDTETFNMFFLIWFVFQILLNKIGVGTWACVKNSRALVNESSKFEICGEIVVFWGN